MTDKKKKKTERKEGVQEIWRACAKEAARRVESCAGGSSLAMAIILVTNPIVAEDQDKPRVRCGWTDHFQRKVKLMNLKNKKYDKKLKLSPYRCVCVSVWKGEYYFGGITDN